MGYLRPGKPDVLALFLSLNRDGNQRQKTAYDGVLDGLRRALELPALGRVPRKWLQHKDSALTNQSPVAHCS